MNAEPDLFTPPARHGDPETSKAAGRSMQRGASIQRDQIVFALKKYGPHNYWELDDILGWQHPTAGRRMCELVRQGRVLETAYTRPTGTGRQARLYRAVP